ncbi:unnamed protein product [Ambrosiozyma monospora]|uniref:Unnamed protein product n=1 Tax=Ambrosiozyma monospora TaxID=43982 RepID=A0A9W6Z3E6_AMBMO|nr:unnamed protein product [Ambrosiozyma monospora]
MENPNATSIDINTIAKMNHVDLSKSEEVLESALNRAKEYARLVGADGPKKRVKPVRQAAVGQKKKKFRYLSKTERKAKNLKERKSSAKRRK